MATSAVIPLDAYEPTPTVPVVSEQDSLDRATLRWQLTSRQRDVLLWLVRGLSNKEIAAELHCSDRTVEVHVSVLLYKSQARSRTHLVTRFWTE